MAALYFPEQEDIKYYMKQKSQRPPPVIVRTLRGVAHITETSGSDYWVQYYKTSVNKTTKSRE
jgi:hypothetical protein